MSKKTPKGIDSIKKHGLIAGQTYRRADVERFMASCSYPFAVPLRGGGFKIEAHNAKGEVTTLLPKRPTDNSVVMSATADPPMNPDVTQSRR